MNYLLMKRQKNFDFTLERYLKNILGESPDTFIPINPRIKNVNPIPGD